MLASPTIVQGLSGPIEVTLIAMYDEYDWDLSDELGNRDRLQKILLAFGVHLEPDLGEGEASIKRVLAPISPRGEKIYLDLINRGESSTCEFKSSLCFDRRRFEAAPTATKLSCISDAVLFSSLKTIAGFLNTDGGTLLIGVEDNGNVVGINDDFEAIPGMKCDFDGFDLYIRGQLRKFFANGDAVNSYVKLSPWLSQGRVVCVCSVAARSSLSFLRKDGTHRLYVRRGTSTSEIPLEHIEHYYNITRMF